MDRTAAYWEAALDQARRQGVTEERITALKSAQILRSLAGKSDFLRAATDVAKNIAVLQAFVAEHRRDYLQPGRLEERERDGIEEQVGAYVRTCTANIQKLEAAVARAQGLSPQGTAHRHGVALILSERLQTVSAVFDICRSQRYQQLAGLKQRQQRRQQELRQHQSPNAGRAFGSGGSAPPTARAAAADPQQQAQLAAENRALQEELQSLGQQVAQTESSMREIATLNQMFSTQVLHQSELTRQLYDQAVQASEALSSGNVQLEKAIRLNSSTRKLLFVFFLVASLLLLLFDWWSS